MRRLNKLITLTLLFLFAGNTFSASAVEERGQAALIFVSSTLAGAPIDLAKLHGKVIILHFWATWCPSCREEMPALDDFYIRHHSQGVEMIAVSADRPRMRDKVIAYMQDFHFPASLISDAIANSFGMPNALPITYVIDAQGKVQKTFTPDKTKLTPQLLESEILPMIPK